MPGAIAFSGLLMGVLGRSSEARESSSRAADVWKSQGAVQYSGFEHLAAAWGSLAAHRPREVTRRIAFAERLLSAVAREDLPAGRMYSMLPLVERDISLGQMDSARARIAHMKDSLGTVNQWIRRLMEYELGFSSGQILLAEGNADSAIALVRSLQAPPNPALYGPRVAVFNLPIVYADRTKLLARAYLAKRDTLSAVRELEQLVRVYPQRPDFRLVNPFLHYDLAVLLEKIGEREKARAQYEKFVQILATSDGTIPQLRRARQRLHELGEPPSAGVSSRTRTPSQRGD